MKLAPRVPSGLRHGEQIAGLAETAMQRHLMEFVRTESASGRSRRNTAARKRIGSSALQRPAAASCTELSAVASAHLPSMNSSLWPACCRVRSAAQQGPCSAKWHLVCGTRLQHGLHRSARGRRRCLAPQGSGAWGSRAVRVAGRLLDGRVRSCTESRPRAPAASPHACLTVCEPERAAHKQRCPCNRRHNHAW